MRFSQMIIGMMLLLSFGVSQAGEARHFFGIYESNYSDSEMNGNSFQYGYDFSNTFSVEFNYSDPDVTGTTASAISVDALGSLMMRYNVRYESINTYFMVGVGYVDYSVLSPASDELETGVTYGFGIELYGSKNTAVSFTWSTSEFEEDGSVAELDTTRVGLIHHFDFAKSASRY